MGYTHYWETSETIPADMWACCVKDACKLVAAAKAERITLWHEYDEPRSKPAVNLKHIWFNGAGDNGHETFAFDHQPTDFTFCKTARKPYDTVVCAILACIAEHTAGIVTVTSDGDTDDWQPGLDFAARVLGRVVPDPVRRE
jgi:hypothetical protein